MTPPIKKNEMKFRFLLGWVQDKTGEFAREGESEAVKWRKASTTS